MITLRLLLHTYAAGIAEKLTPSHVSLNNSAARSYFKNMFSETLDHIPKVALFLQCLVRI